MIIDRHHLLECILWPNRDGTYRKIVNRAERLRELCIYDDYKMTIPIEHGVHQSMHRVFEKGTEYERDISGDKHPMYGTKCSDETRKKISENTPMRGRTGENHPAWKGDNVGPAGSYKRAKKLYKDGKLTEDEFQHYRDDWAEYKCQRRIAKNTSSDS